VITLYNWPISLKNTIIVDKIRPKPIEKTITYIIGTNDNNIVTLNGAPNINIIIIIAKKENNRLTTLDIIFETGNKYLGTYTFFIKLLLSKIECIAFVVDSDIN